MNTALVLCKRLLTLATTIIISGCNHVAHVLYILVITYSCFWIYAFEFMPWLSHSL